MPLLARKLKIAVPDHYRRLITFSHRGSMGLDYGSSDYMHITVITVNHFSKDFSSERMWWSWKGPRFVFGGWWRVSLWCHLSFITAVRGTPGVGGTACSGGAPGAWGDGGARGRLWCSLLDQGGLELSGRSTLGSLLLCCVAVFDAHVALLYGLGIGAKDLPPPQEGCNITLSSLFPSGYRIPRSLGHLPRGGGKSEPNQSCRQCVAIPELCPARLPLSLPSCLPVLCSSPSPWYWECWDDWPWPGGCSSGLEVPLSAQLCWRLHWTA